MTETEVLYATTCKYTASIDDKLYRTEYSGLKKIDNEWLNEKKNQKTNKEEEIK